MKKIIFIIIGLICFCSCVNVSEYQEHRNRDEKRSKQIQDHCFIVELEFEGGHKHEYIFFKYAYGEAAGITHYPDCKYCKEFHY